jgi:hypothetical protein
MAEENLEKKSEVTFGEFKGSPVISLPLSADGKFSFTFGLSKAKAIMKYQDEIKKFVDQHDKETKS